MSGHTSRAVRVTLAALNTKNARNVLAPSVRVHSGSPHVGGTRALRNTVQQCYAQQGVHTRAPVESRDTPQLHVKQSVRTRFINSHRTSRAQHGGA